MSVSKADRSTEQRSNDLTTIADVAKLFCSSGSPRVMLAAILVVGSVRIASGSVGWFDLALIVLTVILAGPFEWVIHRGLLHAPENSFRMTRLGTGTGHRRHHLDPQDLGWVLLYWQDALVFILLLVLWSALWSISLAAVVGVALLPAVATATLCAFMGLVHYEWTHLLIHTRYRPKTRFYKRLAKNHRLHHHRNEHYWLGVTSNLGDRVLQTLPADPGDVPLSETARNLDD